MSDDRPTDATAQNLGNTDSTTVPELDKSVAKSLWERYVYHFLAAAAFVILAVGTVVYHYVEGWSWVDSFYFCAVAGSTVGFGDLAPTTDASKLFTVLYLFSAVAILGAFFNERMKYHGVGRKRIDSRIADSTNKDQT
jgi:hypothetical protein